MRTFFIGKFISFKMRKMVYAVLSSYTNLPEETVKLVSEIIETEICSKFWIKNKDFVSKKNKVA